MSEEKKDEKTQRDARGLTMGHRAMLRLFVVFQQTGAAAAKIGDDTDLRYLLGTPLVTSAVQDLLVFTSELAKKIGSTEEIAAYLNQYAAEDNAFFTKCRDLHYATEEAAAKEVLNEAFADTTSGPPCPHCGEGTCINCEVCHACNIDMDEEDEEPPHVLN